MQKKNQFCPLCKGSLECFYWHHDWQSQHILNSEYICILFIKYVPLQSKHKLCITWENAILVSYGIYKISRNILILHSKFVKFPKPTHFQCVYCMYVLGFTLYILHFTISVGHLVTGIREKFMQLIFINI